MDAKRRGDVMDPSEQVFTANAGTSRRIKIRIRLLGVGRSILPAPLSLAGFSPVSFSNPLERAPRFFGIRTVLFSTSVVTSKFRASLNMGFHREWTILLPLDDVCPDAGVVAGRLVAGPELQPLSSNHRASRSGGRLSSADDRKLLISRSPAQVRNERLNLCGRRSNGLAAIVGSARAVLLNRGPLPRQFVLKLLRINEAFLIILKVPYHQQLMAHSILDRWAEHCFIVIT